MGFTRALVRPPAATFASGITASGLGPPDLALARQQHDAYCRTLERLGLSLVRLPPDPAFPDSTFVEDTAVVTGRSAILTRPGAPSRVGEVAPLGPVLREWFSELATITAPGTLDGGDVCDAGRLFFIGLSGRTNAEGAAQMAEWLSDQGFSSSVIDIRAFPGLLHLKTGLSWLGGRRLLAVANLARHEALRDWEVLPVSNAEEYAANCIVINELVLMPRGFPSAAPPPQRARRLAREHAEACARLSDLGHEVVPLDMSEFQRMDGGPSCLSLRW